MTQTNRIQDRLLAWNVDSYVFFEFWLLGLKPLKIFQEGSYYSRKGSVEAKTKSNYFFPSSVLNGKSCSFHVTHKVHGWVKIMTHRRQPFPTAWPGLQKTAMFYHGTQTPCSCIHSFSEELIRIFYVPCPAPGPGDIWSTANAQVLWLILQAEKQTTHKLTHSGLVVRTMKETKQDNMIPMDSRGCLTMRSRGHGIREAEACVLLSLWQTLL